MLSADDLFSVFSRSYESYRETEMSPSEYLEACRDNPMIYATAAERLLAAIGEPEMVDTAKDARLGSIFMNRTIRVYPTFSEFYGMEDERIVGLFRHAAQCLEERKQILHPLGPVGGGKSSLAECLKALIEPNPIHVLKAGNELSLVSGSPLGLLIPDEMGPPLEGRRQVRNYSSRPQGDELVIEGKLASAAQRKRLYSSRQKPFSVIRCGSVPTANRP